MATPLTPSFKPALFTLTRVINKARVIFFVFVHEAWIRQFTKLGISTLWRSSFRRGNVYGIFIENGVILVQYAFPRRGVEPEEREEKTRKAPAWEREKW
jgi:hypothetical protein